MVARNVTRGAALATDLEVADGLWGKFKGLMGRRSLPAGGGLWLPESNGIHMMFMRFPIDAVFVGKPVEGAAGVPGAATGAVAGAAGAVAGAAASSVVRAVLSVHPGLRAWTGLVPLVRGAHGVLELPVGTIQRTATAVGDLIAFEET